MIAITKYLLSGDRLVLRYACPATIYNVGSKLRRRLIDLYAFLVNFKHDLELVAWRTKYYRFMVAAVLELLGIPSEKVHFVDGSSYELTKQFSLDNYRLCTIVDEQDARDTGDEYRHSTRPSVLLCPGLPALAEEYLDADFQFGGEDQVSIFNCPFFQSINLIMHKRGLFAFNERFLPKLGFRKRAHMMNAMIPGLTGTKMSSSIPESKIDLLDDRESVQKKVSAAICDDRVIVGNGILPIIKEIIFPIAEIIQARSRTADLTMNSNATSTQCQVTSFCSQGAPNHALLSIPTTTESGCPTRHYTTYTELEEDFRSGRFPSSALKLAVIDAINWLLDPLRRSFENNREWQRVTELAYPD